MKRIFILALFFLTFSTASLAQLSPSELDFVFERGDTLELAYLSDTEMQETKGAVISVAPILGRIAAGAAIGAAGYLIEHKIFNYTWNTSRFIGNTIMGAATGSYFSWGAKMASGIGSLVWRANGWILNSGLNRIWRR